MLTAQSNEMTNTSALQRRPTNISETAPKEVHMNKFHICTISHATHENKTSIGIQDLVEFLMEWRNVMRRKFLGSS